ncbi:MAG: hypothetical protein EU530_03405 [Promethearchaeota archaeon]|nr:MAG: hypothetical protein EU530_03405 [Candidatus Lokiarchaeota archaeon]
MQSIKVSDKTKERIDKTQAKILLERDLKITQADLLERIVVMATEDEEFMDALFSPVPPVKIVPKKKVGVKIISRKKPFIRLYPEEWED